MSFSKQEIVNQSFKDHTARARWDEAITLFDPANDVKPSKELVFQVLEKNGSLLSLRELKALLNLGEDYTPNAQLVSSTLENLVRYKGVFSDWATAEYLCGLQTENKPNKQAINKALERASVGHAWKLLAQLCVMTNDNRPDEVIKNNALGHLIKHGKKESVKSLCESGQLSQQEVSLMLEHAVDHLNKFVSLDKDWSKVEYLCSLQTDNKPNQQAINKTLNIAVKLYNWTVVEQLCAMSGDNKPEALTVRNATLCQLVIQGNKERLQSLCEGGQFNQEEINFMLDRAFDYLSKQASINQDWSKINYLCGLQTKNKPNQQAISKALKSAIDEWNWSLAEQLCALTGDNRPDEDSVSYARKKANLREKVEFIKKLQPDVKERQEKEPLDQQIKDTDKPELVKEDRQHSLQELHRKQIIQRASGRLEDILTTLSKKIGKIDQHHFESAYTKAGELLKTLNQAKKDYLKSLENADIDLLTINREFEQKCADLIRGAKSVLEKDLSWGDYWGNLFKSIANTIIWAGSFGQVNTLFSLKRPQSAIDVEEAEEQMKNEI